MATGRAGIRCNINEDVIVEFNRTTIPNSVFGEFTQLCTTVTALNLIDFFTSKQPYPIEKINVQLLDNTTTYNIIDVINMLIENNYINLNTIAIHQA